MKQSEGIYDKSTKLITNYFAWTTHKERHKKKHRDGKIHIETQNKEMKIGKVLGKRKFTKGR
jgi:hypothetical protein